MKTNHKNMSSCYLAEYDACSQAITSYYDNHIQKKTKKITDSDIIKQLCVFYA